MMSNGSGSSSSSNGRNYRFPFTANQWQELEHQALIFKYMISGMPIPPDLLYTIRRSLDSTLSSKLLLHHHHHQPQHHSKLLPSYFSFFFFFFLWDDDDDDVWCSWMELFSDGFWKKNRPRTRKV